jgi:DNA-binding NarL/FixJ family response regulator
LKAAHRLRLVRASVPTKTVIIEDETVFRQMLSLALGKVRGLKLVAECGDGPTGIEACVKHQPDLLVTDLYLPGLHGLEVIRQVREKVPAMRILVLTSRPDADLPAKLIAQGVHGFVDKTEPLHYVLQAVETVMKGGMFFASNVPPTQGAAEEPVAPEVLAAITQLSPREIEVARLVSQGRTSKEVASQLDLSVRTVEKHRANIMDKLGVREVASLVRLCVQAGLTKG